MSEVCKMSEQGIQIMRPQNCIRIEPPVMGEAVYSSHSFDWGRLFLNLLIFAVVILEGFCFSALVVILTDPQWYEHLVEPLLK